MTSSKDRTVSHKELVNQSSSRRQFLRFLASAGGVGAVGVVLAACGGANPATPADSASTDSNTASGGTTTNSSAATSAPALNQGSVTVTVMSQANEFSDDEVQKFMDANPDIKLERIENDATRFKAMLAAGTPPDIFRVQGPQIANLAARDLLLDLTNYFQGSSKLKMDDLAPSVNFYKVDGKLYGMPKDWSPDMTLYASKPAFEEAGIAMPSADTPLRYADIAGLATQLTKREGDRIVRMGYAFETGFLPRHLQTLLMEQDQKLYSDDMSKIVLRENPMAVEVLRFFHDLSKDGVTFSPMNPAKAWNGQDYIDGSVGLVQYGYWFSGMIFNTADAKIGGDATMFLPAPSWTGKKVINPTVTATGFSVAQATKNPDAAWKVFEYYNADEPAIARAKSGWGVPALKSLYAQMPKDSAFQGQVQSVLQSEFNNADYQLQVNPYYDDNAFVASWSKNLEQSLKGDITFDQLLENVENEVDQAIADGKTSIE